MGVARPTETVMGERAAGAGTVPCHRLLRGLEVLGEVTGAELWRLSCRVQVGSRLERDSWRV